ncbi:MAG: hypothetical protein KJN92_11095, partial [Gemmatimonadetes bacterium]|nr:hypothetical protein [Gemmatimonadota bacterium]
MRRLCAWCMGDLGDGPDPGESDRPITHGICEPCSLKVLGNTGIPMREFLGSLGVPTLLVTEDVVVERANPAASDMVGKSLDGITGKRGGEVFECENAALPGGCGQTPLCSACTVRRTVTETYQTGDSQVCVPVTLTVDTEGTPGEISFLITTEKVGDRVLV